MRAINNKERTFVLVKPDGVSRGLIGEIISKFENKGLKLVALKMLFATKEHVENHYHDLTEKEYFKRFTNYMISGPIVASVWEGINAVKVGRSLVGLPDPTNSESGTIRGEYCIEKPRKAISGSDTSEDAEREIQVWFSKEEIQSWTKVDEEMIFE